jgi:hypothetical protein
LIGAGKDATIIDAQQAGNSNRIMYIASDYVQVKNMWLKGGKFVQGGTVNWAGAGILIHGDYVLLENVRVSDCYQNGDRNIGVIANSYANHGNVEYMGEMLQFKNIEICNNIHTNRGADGSAGALYLRSSSSRLGTNFVANAHVHSNTNMPSLFLAPEYDPGRMIAFGCLVENNKLGGGSGVQSGGEVVLWRHALFVVNCTIADNATNSIRSTWYTGGNKILNSIISNNGALPYVDSDRTLYFMYNLINETGFTFSSSNSGLIDGYSTSSSDDGTNITNSPPYFKNQTGRDYRLLPESPAIDAGATLLTTNASAIFPGGGSQIVRYVDVDRNNVYSRFTDVIVDLGGYVPSDSEMSTNWVMTTDLAGNARVRRVKSNNIDMGAYEYRQPAGTIIFFK